MLHSQSLNNKINSPHKKGPRTIHGDKISLFQNLLKKDNCFHTSEKLKATGNKNLKAHKSMVPGLLNDTFKQRTMSANCAIMPICPEA